MMVKRIRVILTIREDLWRQVKEMADSQNRSRPKMVEWILLEQVRGIPSNRAKEMIDEKLHIESEDDE